MIVKTVDIPGWGEVDCMKLFAYAHAITQNRDDSDDIVQEVCLRIVARKPDAPPVLDKAAWLRGVIKFVSVGIFNKARPDRHESVDELTKWEERETEKVIEGLLVVSHEGRIADNDVLLKAAIVLKQMPYQDRECVLMYARGYTFVQIANALGIPYTVAIKKTRKAIARTARAIKEK